MKKRKVAKKLVLGLTVIFAVSAIIIFIKKIHTSASVANTVKISKPLLFKTIPTNIVTVQNTDKKQKIATRFVIPSNFNYPFISYGVRGKNIGIAECLLSRLGYLPLICNTTFKSVNKEQTKPLRNKAADNLTSYSFHWSWKWKNIPQQIKQNWKPKVFNTLLLGAIMEFRRQNEFIVRGNISKPVWKAMIRDYNNKVKIKGYKITYVWADKNFPKMLHLWQNGKNIISSFVNTGIPETSTFNGVYPIYARFFNNTMEGITPWKKTYKDKNIPFVNYFNGGEAVHGFPRALYGTNQSLGCLELPLTDASIFWKNINYGTLVDVSKATAAKPFYSAKLVPSKTHIKIFSKNIPWLKFIYTDYSLTFNDIPITSINLFSIDKKSFKILHLLTSDIRHGADIGFIAKNYNRQGRLLYFTDTKDLKGTYIRSIYSLYGNDLLNSKDETNDFMKIKIRRLLTIKKPKMGILSNLAVDKKNKFGSPYGSSSSIWVVLYSYTHNKFRNYLDEIILNKKKDYNNYYIKKQIPLNIYVPYLTYDKKGNLWLSGFKFKKNKCDNFIEEIKSKYFNGNNYKNSLSLHNKTRQSIKNGLIPGWNLNPGSPIIKYSIPSHFCGIMPILPENNGNIWILKYSDNNHFKNYIIKIERKFVKHRPSGFTIKNIVGIGGYVGNLALNNKGNLLFIDTVLQKGIFHKRLYEIRQQKIAKSRSWHIKKVLSFYGKLNGVSGGIMLLNQ